VALPVTVNRVIPPIGPLKSGLEFSASPTPRDFFDARVFEEPLVPIGGEPTTVENAALASALLQYAKRAGPDDFSGLTGFMERHPVSPWRAALLTNLGFDYYNTARYSKALEAWAEAWKLAKEATDPQAKVIADRAAGELASMYARLGMMTDLESHLNSVEGRVFLGPATEKISGARGALWTMQNRPEIAFRCGPLALHRIKLAADPHDSSAAEIFSSVSTQRGFSLPQVADLSARIGLGYQMAFREKAGAFVVPSVVHWKVGHYAALVRQDGDRFLLKDPTFGNDVWATRQALESETSGYFVVPPGPLATGWRTVETREGEAIWGKGVTASSDPEPCTCEDEQTGGACPGGGCIGMAVSSVHLMLVSLSIRDQPVGYSPPVGPSVRFTAFYNHRDAFQPANFAYSNFGPKWTCDWIGYITDNPQNPLAAAKYYVLGGGTRSFSGFNEGTQSYEPQQYDQTLLKRTAPDSYEMVAKDGSKLIFGKSDGSVGTSRKIFLTEVVDAAGNAVTLAYDGNLRVMALIDAIGQVTTFTYGHPTDVYKVTKVTDPFGRFATFGYDGSGRLNKITDVIGLTSEFTYDGAGDFINSLVTPYGTTGFTRGEIGTTRWLETQFPDGSRDRVEYNQGNHIAASDPPASLPQGMGVNNHFLYGRNTYYWSRTASATSHGDYSKAKIYHWLHTADGASTAGILESTKEALEGRVWFNYANQGVPQVTGGSNRPTRVGRVLDNGETQLHEFTYNKLGLLETSTDPLGRKLKYVYSPGTSGPIDLLEVRQTRAGNDELLFSATYDEKHRPLQMTDAAGGSNNFTYNVRGQLIAHTNPKGETTEYSYSTDGFLISADGPLPGTSDLYTATYDVFGRIRTRTDESGYTLTINYDDMDRVTKVNFPDSTFHQFTYDRLDQVSIQDRAGRRTFMDYDAMRQLKKRTDPLGRTTHFQWCRCGSIKSLTDSMGRTTSWLTDVQGRPFAKQFADGSQITYHYENNRSRLRQMVDERQQITHYAYHRDDMLKSLTYSNAASPTPSVEFTYDANYQRLISMTDGIGKTLYSYHPITLAPAAGAGRLAGVDGPLSGDTITYGYDGLGRRVQMSIGGAAATINFDAAGRVAGETNALGAFTNAYDGASSRLTARTFPNNQVTDLSFGGNLHDQKLERITNRIGATPLSDFIYGHDVPAGRVASRSERIGSQSPILHTFAYDAVDQLLGATLTDAGTPVAAFAYSYDPAGNRVAEQTGATANTATYNTLNQLSTISAAGAARTNEWDAQSRLTAVVSGNQRTEFTYDGWSRLASIRHLTDGSEVSLRRFVWCGKEMSEERDASGAVTKRFFPQGMKIEAGPLTGSYFYTRDHLGSIRELTDGSGNVRARYSYDPYGRRTRVSGDVEADFGFTGMFWTEEARLSLTHFRAYDPDLGRWLSRDPLEDAELEVGANLYAYVGNDPVNYIDPEGLSPITPGGLSPLPCLTTVDCACLRNPALCSAAGIGSAKAAEPLMKCKDTLPGLGPDTINVFANTMPSLLQVGLRARRAEAWTASLSPSNKFWQDWVDASRRWRDLDLTQEQAREAMMWISRWAESLF